MRLDKFLYAYFVKQRGKKNVGDMFENVYKSKVERLYQGIFASRDLFILQNKSLFLSYNSR